jgi:hypothetical protein
VVDDLIVVPGARLNAQNQPPGPQMVTITLPSSNPGGVSFDGNSNQPIQALKDRTGITVRWAAHDDNGDDLIYSLYLRGDGEKVWRLLKGDLTDKAYSFDASLIPDGGYQVKVVASDAPSRNPGDALTGSKISERFEVDTTPPVVSALSAVEAGGPVRITFEAEDASSPISHAEYSIDAAPWKFIAPVGGLSDARHERYELRLAASELDGKSTEHLLTVRVYDRYDNVGVAKTVFSTPSR